MSLLGKKIWIDAEEPKVPIMFQSLFRWFEKAGAKIFITARDFDSTFKIFDHSGIKYTKVGKHGGNTLQGKLKTYIDRLDALLPIIDDFKPDFLVTFGSVEASRIAMGLGIPSIGYSDEPRSTFVSRQLFPCIDKLITPNCIPVSEYLELGANNNKIIRYDGIDEIAWLKHYKPNKKILDQFNVEPGKFVLMRSEPTFASYFIDKLKHEETYLAKYFPQIFKICPNYTYFLLVRTEEQEIWLKNQLKDFIPNANIVITKFLPNIMDLCFFSSLVISGGGTIVRESSLLGVPSIEYFPGESAPQERWLIENGFPMEHIREPQQIIERAIEIITQGPSKDRFTLDFKSKIVNFEDPNEICFNYVKNYFNTK